MKKDTKLAKPNRSRVHALLAFLLCLCASGADAQSYPAKPVRVVVPWPPAGVTDVLTRALAQAMSESTGQQFVVENRPRAGSEKRARRLHHRRERRAEPRDQRDALRQAAIRRAERLRADRHDRRLADGPDDPSIARRAHAA